jgi:hypothetical protein
MFMGEFSWVERGRGDCTFSELIGEVAEEGEEKIKIKITQRR